MQQPTTTIDIIRLMLLTYVAANCQTKLPNSQTFSQPIKQQIIFMFKVLNSCKIHLFLNFFPTKKKAIKNTMLNLSFVNKTVKKCHQKEFSF